ncbi:MAG TPA: hypothetical protein VGV57_09060 [Thermoleophilaceae bacterium]|nr:hypothetical protein [Thermoleophilaceae bacterium]
MAIASAVCPAGAIVVSPRTRPPWRARSRHRQRVGGRLHRVVRLELLDPFSGIRVEQIVGKTARALLSEEVRVALPTTDLGNLVCGPVALAKVGLDELSEAPSPRCIIIRASHPREQDRVLGEAPSEHLCPQSASRRRRGEDSLEEVRRRRYERRAEDFPVVELTIRGDRPRQLPPEKSKKPIYSDE